MRATSPPAADFEVGLPEPDVLLEEPWALMSFSHTPVYFIQSIPKEIYRVVQKWLYRPRL